MPGPAPDDAAADLPYRGRLAGGEHRFAVRVYWEDTDAGGVVYHAGYLRFLERARSDLVALAGIDQAAMLAAGGGTWVVRDAALRFHRAAALGDALVVASQVAALAGARCVVQQRVSREAALVLDGRIELAFVGPGGRPRRQPAAWGERLAAAGLLMGEDGVTADVTDRARDHAWTT